ncbi:MAG TPA: dienelactone hydrolase family protein [bacterium]|nr:dienelactone hydrolase family protein [bacterium]
MPREDLAHFHSETRFAFQMMRLVSEGLEPMEALRVLRGVKTSDDWTRGLKAAGDRWARRAEEDLRLAHKVSARGAYRSATHFYLGAALWNTPNPWGTGDIYRSAVENFRQFNSLLERPAKVVELPFRDTTLPGYLYLPEPSRKKVPAVVLMGGADATKEEAYGFGVPMILDRGIACLTLDGPGQGECLRFRSLYTIPEYEQVYGAALDFLESIPEVDRSRLGIVGLSMGGYYVVRGATDARVKAAVSWGALYSVGGLNMSLLSTTIRFITGSDSEEQMFDKIKSFTIEKVASKVTCPVLLVHSGQDHLVSPDEVERVRQALVNAEVDVNFYDDALHCCIDRYLEARPRIFDWIADRLCK